MNIGIIGAGGWGTTLAKTLCENNEHVKIWTHESETRSEINLHHTNHTYLKGIRLPTNISSTLEPSDLKNSDIFINAVPTQFIRSVFKDFDFPLNNRLLVNVSKGIEINSLLRVSEIFTEIIDLDPENYVVLTGPSHAEEVARKAPTTVVAASDNHDNCALVQSVFSTPYFRIYSSDDVIGCELGGSLKNIIAIAAGIIDGLKLGDNPKAALITRGLANISRLGAVFGANPMTFFGLSGFGDLIVTCNSKHSRNRYVGEQIGKGLKLPQILNQMQMVAEGIGTTESAYKLSKKHDVEMPIVDKIYSILFEDEEPLQAINDLMTRRSRREWWW